MLYPPQVNNWLATHCFINVQFREKYLRLKKMLIKTVPEALQGSGFIYILEHFLKY